MVPLEYYTPLFYHMVLFLSILVLGYTAVNTGKDLVGVTFTKVWSVLLCVMFILYMGMRPISGYYFVDMRSYSIMFELAKNTTYNMSENVEWFFSWYNWFLAQYIEKETYFLICTIIYIGSLWLACRRLFTIYYFYGFLVCIGAFSFWTYGVNGIRNGIATSLLLLAFTYSNIKLIMIFLFVIASGFHNSVLLPMMAFVIGYFYKNTKVVLLGWLLTIPMSLVLGSYFEIFFASLGFDDRLTSYILNESNNSQFSSSGFRWDFLFYSSIPVFLGYHYIVQRGYKERLYNQLFIAYLISNGFWILVIRASFSNRFAYLSWFMIPIIIIYPLLKKRIWKRQYFKVGIIVLSHFLFTYLMFLRDYL